MKKAKMTLNLIGQRVFKIGCFVFTTNIALRLLYVNQVITHLF